MRRLQVLHIIDTLKTGGTENRCVEIATGLNERYFESHLLHFDKGTTRPEKLLSVPIVRVDITSFRSPSFLRTLWQIVQYIKAQDIKIIQTYGYYSNVPGILAGYLARVPAIIASRRDMGEFLSPGQRRLEHLLWRLADRVVVNATAIKQALAHAGVPREKLVVIPNGVVCTEGFVGGDRMNGMPRIGMIANFRKQKDYITFLDAAKIVLSQRPDTHFVTVGSGPRVDEVRSYARAQGLEGRVEFLGTMSETSVLAIHQSLTVSVLSSHGNEGLPNVVLEAMAAGIPVIASDVGGTREAIVDGKTGFLIPPRNPAALAEKILWVLKNSEEARTMGMEGRHRAESLFSLSKMQESFENLYVQLLNEKGYCIGR